MDKRILGIAQVLVVILAVVFALNISSHLVVLKSYGYLGVFIISTVSAASLFFPTPEWAIVIAMSTVLNPYLLGIVAGVGAAIGELTGYFAGSGARKIIQNHIKEFDRAEQLITKYGFAGIFFLALIPNPIFDIAGIVAGSMRIPVLEYLAACAAGRVLRYILLAYFSAWAIGLIM